jgi:hypothetical protein
MSYIIACSDCGAELMASNPLDRIECVGDGSHAYVAVVRYSPISSTAATDE